MSQSFFSEGIDSEPTSAIAARQYTYYVPISIRPVYVIGRQIYDEPKRVILTVHNHIYEPNYIFMPTYATNWIFEHYISLDRKWPKNKSMEDLLESMESSQWDYHANGITISTSFQVYTM